MFVRGFDHGESVFDKVRHGLLAVNVFTGGAGVFEDVTVLVVHGSDEDGVDIFTIEDGAIVASGGDAGIFNGFASGSVAAVIEVADGDALDAGNAERGLEVFASANARANGCKTDGVAGRDRAGRKQTLRLQDRFGRCRGGDSAGTDLDELTTRQGIFCHEISALEYCDIFRNSGWPARRVYGEEYPQERAI